MHVWGTTLTLHPLFGAGVASRAPGSSSRARRPPRPTSTSACASKVRACQDFRSIPQQADVHSVADGWGVVCSDEPHGLGGDRRGVRRRGEEADPGLRGPMHTGTTHGLALHLGHSASAMRCRLIDLADPYARLVCAFSQVYGRAVGVKAVPPTTPLKSPPQSARPSVQTAPAATASQPEPSALSSLPSVISQQDIEAALATACLLSAPASGSPEPSLMNLSTFEVCLAVPWPYGQANTVLSVLGILCSSLH